MRCHFSCSNRENTKVIDCIKKGKRFDYLRPKGELVLWICENYGVPQINVNF